MNNKLNNMIQDYFKNNKVDSIEEANKKLQDFLEMYNNNEIEYKNTPLDDAYEILDKAENAKSKKEAIRLAKEAYKKTSECFDAIIFLCELEENAGKKMSLLNEGLIKEKERLIKEKYFEKENIGHFYGIFETRPYIRGLVTKVEFLLDEGKLRLAEELCKEILRLNTNDNLGARYLLMAIYAVLEDENNMMKLYKKYPEENLEMFIPLFALNYKIGNDKKAKNYLEKIHNCNPNFVKLFNGTIKMNEDIEPGCYSRGNSSEVLMYIDRYIFLIMSMPGLKEYVLENIKIDKKNNK